MDKTSSPIRDACLVIKQISAEYILLLEIAFIKISPTVSIMLPGLISMLRYESLSLLYANAHPFVGMGC